MNKISIITGSELRQVQGVNYFIKSFIECNKSFKDIYVTKVYSSMQVLNIDNGDQMPIGEDQGTANYAVRTRVRTILRKILTLRFYPFALLRYEFNFYYNSSKSVKKYFDDNASTDYILFQELGCAYYYFRYLNRSSRLILPKTALVIHTEDDSGSMLMNTFKGFGRRDMQRRFDKRRDFVYSRIDKVIYISRKAYNNSILPVEKRGFVYNGSPDIPYSFVHPEFDVKKMRFVCVGSFVGRKGQDKILEAMKIMDSDHLKKMHVTFVGDGPELDNVKKQADTYRLTEYVTFMGQRNDVAEILKNMDVFIMPSMVEGLPMSVIEAMRAGLFLILTDTGGNIELCDKNCGYVCTRETQDILEKMCRVIDGAVISVEQKIHSRERFVKEFSLESMACGYENVLTNI
ncbi:glycosyltransferase family 4 protein [Bacteroides graminisolvens]|uniref:glycosyltransferase family 4 protein n=1 Tax=Bacteroides graminisolvens TaxID=477666 RepID=UPI0003FE9E57|nr:glycosyltransferase family 4 protein [Bacteroides graminisolvens]